MDSSLSVSSFPPGVFPTTCSKPKHQNSPSGALCVWLVHSHPGDDKPHRKSDVLKNPRGGVPLYVQKHMTMNELLFSVRDINGFQHTIKLSLRRLHQSGEYKGWWSRAGETPLGSLLEIYQQPIDDIVFFCETARYQASQKTQRLAKVFGLDYETEYSFAYETRTGGDLGCHHYLALYCPELDREGRYLRAEMHRPPLGINVYTLKVSTIQEEPTPSRAAPAQVKTSLKRLDATFAHVVEKYPAYSLKNINCQYFCDKSAKLLGFQRTLRAQWCDKVLRTCGRSEAYIRRRHESAATRPPRCPEKLGKRVRRWLHTKIARRRPDRHRSP